MKSTGARRIHLRLAEVVPESNFRSARCLLEIMAQLASQGLIVSLPCVGVIDPETEYIISLLPLVGPPVHLLVPEAVAKTTVN